MFIKTEVDAYIEFDNFTGFRVCESYYDPEKTAENPEAKNPPIIKFCVSGVVKGTFKNLQLSAEYSTMKEAQDKLQLFMSRIPKKENDTFGPTYLSFD